MNSEFTNRRGTETLFEKPSSDATESMRKRSEPVRVHSLVAPARQRMALREGTRTSVASGFQSPFSSPYGAESQRAEGRTAKAVRIEFRNHILGVFKDQSSITQAQNHPEGCIFRLNFNKLSHRSAITMISAEPLNILYQNCTGRVRNIRALGLFALDALFNRLKSFDTLQAPC
jgi:hypothetical protein